MDGNCNKVIKANESFYLLDQKCFSCHFIFLMNYITNVCSPNFFIDLFGLVLYVPVNSSGHVGTVNSPNHTFS